MMQPSIQLLVKLGSIAVHAEELMESEATLRKTSPASPEADAASNAVLADRNALEMLLNDADVRKWILEMGVMLPRKRKGPTWDDTGKGKINERKQERDARKRK